LRDHQNRGEFCAGIYVPRLPQVKNNFPLLFWYIGRRMFGITAWRLNLQSHVHANLLVYFHSSNWQLYKWPYWVHENRWIPCLFLRPAINVHGSTHFPFSAWFPRDESPVLINTNPASRYILLYTETWDVSTFISYSFLFLLCSTFCTAHKACGTRLS
jgi:hypothetical protein